MDNLGKIIDATLGSVAQSAINLVILVNCERLYQQKMGRVKLPLYVDDRTTGRSKRR